jgi:hypothetical protein
VIGRLTQRNWQMQAVQSSSAGLDLRSAHAGPRRRSRTDKATLAAAVLPVFLDRRSEIGTSGVIDCIETTHTVRVVPWTTPRGSWPQGRVFLIRGLVLQAMAIPPQLATKKAS